MKTEIETVGKVYLVGGGPGDPGLLTLKGRNCLAQADLVLYDGLVNPLLLRHTSAECERTCRSPGPDGLRLDQEEISRRLIAAARSGKTVVRLKGGDPYIFGRGSEEARALAEEGIPFEVVPGVTAATAASTYAGISLTHRETASAVAFITGHEDPAKAESSIDYDLLAKFDGTLVFYMGLHRLEKICQSLIAFGRSPDEPACVISRATTPDQRTVAATLAELPAAVRSAGLHAPSLIVVGECVRQRETIAWFEKKPLFGLRIGITRPEGQADSAIERAMELGAQPVLLPTIRILPIEDYSAVDSFFDRIGEYDWIVFTSANGVEAFFGRLWHVGYDLRLLSYVRLAVIGPSTAEALERFHLRADIIPEEYRAESLAEALIPHVDGCRVLWARASRGRDVLPRELESAGATVEELVVYQNIDADSLPKLDVDWIGLSSPSIARNFAKLIDAETKAKIDHTIHLASISPVTSAAAREVGLTISAEATEYTWEGIFDAICRSD